MRRSLILRLTCLFLAQILIASFVFAQQPEAPSKKVTVWPFPTGMHRYEPGKWSSVGLRVANHRSHDVEKRVSLYGNLESRLQYGRKMWIPAKSVRATWLPFRVPEEVPEYRKSVDLYLLNFDDTQPDEVLAHRPDDQMVAHSLISIDRSRAKTAAIFNNYLTDLDGEIAAKDIAVYQLVVASKESSGRSRIVVNMKSDFFPRTTAAFDSVDQLILCSDRITSDSAGLFAIRRWLQQGGRLWIMLDRISRETLIAVLGDGACCEIVNRTELTQLTIEDAKQPVVELQRDFWKSDRPVSFIEVVTDSVDVHCWVNGWPAAFWKSIGRGEVLITTLGPRGWVHEVNPFEDRREGERPAIGPTKALQSVATRFFDQKTPEMVELDALRPLLLEQIGYDVPSRRIAISVLMSSCIGLLLGGLWLHKMGSPRHIAWLAPLICLAAAGFMFWVGFDSARKVPASVAFLQFVQVSPETHTADCRSLLAFYSERTRELPLRAGRDTLMIPETSDLDGVIKRVTWDDYGHSSWKSISVKPSTVRFVEMRTPISWNDSVQARGSFGPNGFQGQIEGEFLADLSDALIASSPAPQLAITIRPSGEFTGDAKQVLAPGQFLPDAMLTDEQRRRLEVFRRVLSYQVGVGFPTRPTLLAWRSAVPFEAELSSGFRSNGSALVAIPLEIERVPPGQRFVVPATFVHIQNAQNERGVSMVFDPRSGKWGEAYSFPTKTRLRFVLPQQVQPCRLSRATVTFKVDVPSRTLRVRGVAGREGRVLFEKANCNGVYHCEILAEDLLRLDEFGGLLLDVEVTDVAVPDKSQANYSDQRKSWQIDYLRVDVEGEAVHRTVDSAK